jgi:DNA-directed RNA polymerase subunit RPC12/RpoP
MFIFERGIQLIAVLYVIGAIVILISIIVGFLSGSFIHFLIPVVGGIFSGIIFFALAQILDNQESILLKLEQQEAKFRKAFPIPKIECPKCNYKYDSDYTSCPHCGHRE